MKWNFATAGTGLVALAILSVVVGYLWTGGATLSGTVFDPAQPAPEIVLTDDQGDSYNLSEQVGKIVLIYFGYTYCPDECPLTLAKLKDVFDLLNEDGTHIQVILITTDPERDTPEALQSYLEKFNESFVGLTGNHADLSKVYSDFGVVVEDGGETHTNRIYGVDKHGNLRITWPYEMTASDIAGDLQILLKE